MASGPGHAHATGAGSLIGVHNLRMARVLVGTADGLHSFDAEGSAGPPALSGHDVWAVAPQTWERLWAIVDRSQIWQGDGQWRRVASLGGTAGTSGLEACCLADTRANRLGGILVGTTRARLLRVAPEGDVEPLAGFDGASGRERWYTPWGAPPDTRTITENRDAVFVNVHVGGVLRSRDEGATWQPTIDVDADVHRVVTGHGRVYAAGAAGLSVSEDGGDTWRLESAGLHAAYCRSVAVCGAHVLLSASEGPGGRRSALYRSDAAAERFERCRAGLPEWFGGNVDSLCLDALPGGELAALGTAGEVHVSADEGATWRRVAHGLPTIHCVLALP
jgi:hypothetical protein